jgi:hypothetical protein
VGAAPANIASADGVHPAGIPCPFPTATSGLNGRRSHRPDMESRWDRGARRGALAGKTL